VCLLLPLLLLLLLLLPLLLPLSCCSCTVCADGIWVQNRCIAQLQALSVVADSQCLETKEVFAGTCEHCRCNGDTEWCSGAGSVAKGCNTTYLLHLSLWLGASLLSFIALCSGQLTCLSCCHCSRCAWQAPRP
jgi:hypothetical protein